MQTDMHYYGTYAMALAAGITRNTARVIAIAAQFVDDNAAKDTIKSGTGEEITFSRRIDMRLLAMRTGNYIY